MTTRQRAVERCNKVMNPTASTVHDETHEMATDLLTDLMHWCQDHDTDFDAALQSAIMHFVAEGSEAV